MSNNIPSNLPPEAKPWARQQEKFARNARVQNQVQSSALKAASRKADTNTQLLHDFVLNRTQPRQFYNEQTSFQVNTNDSIFSIDIPVGVIDIPEGFNFCHIDMLTLYVVNNTTAIDVQLSLSSWYSSDSSMLTPLGDFDFDGDLLGGYFNALGSLQTVSHVTVPTSGVIELANFNFRDKIFLTNAYLAYNGPSVNLNCSTVVSGSVYFSKTGE